MANSIDLDTAVKIALPTASLAVGWWQRRRIKVQIKKTTEWIDAKKEQEEKGIKMRKDVGNLIDAVAGGDTGKEINDGITLLESVKKRPSNASTTIDASDEDDAPAAHRRHERRNAVLDDPSPESEDISMAIEESVCPYCSKPLQKEWGKCHYCSRTVRNLCPKCGELSPVDHSVCVNCEHVFVKLHRFEVGKK